MRDYGSLDAPVVVTLGSDLHSTAGHSEEGSYFADKRANTSGLVDYVTLA